MAERDIPDVPEYLREDPRDDHREDPDIFPDDTLDPVGDTEFDAFNERTWTFDPDPTPWHRTRLAVTALVATSAAAVALVVAAVLLVFRDAPADEVSTPEPSVTQTAPTSAAPPEAITSAAPPPQPPPPAPTSASRIYTPPPERSRPARPSRKPEIGVTRAPATRSPISVRPQPRS